MWPKPKVVTGWRKVEREFRQHRDRRVKVTLPRLSCLEEDDQQESERLDQAESLRLRT